MYKETYMHTSNKKTRPKRSKIWLMPSDEFRDLVKNSITYTAILSVLGYTVRGGAFKLLKKRILEENIDDTHILQNGKQIVFAHHFNKRADSDVFVKNSTYNNGSHLKKRLLQMGVLEQCDMCGIMDSWNGKFLSLQIDHINGISNDNRIENLRIICPNCHSQTETFAGKKLNKGEPKLRGKTLHNDRIVSKMQKKYFDSQVGEPKLHLRRVNRPDKETLKKLLWEMPTTKIATIYGVSDKAVEKWAKSYELTKPPRGYWAKQKSPRSSTDRAQAREV